jgi:ATP-dependent DNA helicase RecG
MEQLTLTFPKHSAMLSPDEIYEGIDSEMLTSLSEDRRIERKPPGIHDLSLGEYFSMWSNTVPDGGLIVVGIEDGGKISGCHKLPTKKLNELEKAPRRLCPEARVESKRVEVVAEDGEPSFVVVFRVQYREDRVVRNQADRAFVRYGDEKHTLSEPEIHELEIDKRQVDIEKESVPLTYPDDFDRELIRKFVEGVKKVHQPLQTYTDVEVLTQRRLGTMVGSTFRPDTACALAFASDPIGLFPGCQIRFLRIDGETEQSGANYNVIKTVPMEGPLPRLLEQAAGILSGQLRDFTRLADDGVFYSAPEYPEAAWYEALVNACVHRSYGLRNMNIFIKMFDDKLVIESPGGFPPLVTPDNIYSMHHPRNPTLMRAMFYMGLVKEHAEGTKRMRDSMQHMKLPSPTFEQIQSGMGGAMVRVTLRNHIKQRKVWVDSDVSGLLGEALARNLSLEEKRVLNFVAEHGKINVTQCHRLIPSLPKWHSAKKLLVKLAEKGMLKPVHSGVLRDNRSHFVLPDAFRKIDEKKT